MLKIDFLYLDPKRKARPEIDELIESGIDQLAIACAYCTAAGVKMLIQHAERLRENDSFLVVSGDSPTDLIALEKLHNRAEGHVYVHLGAQKPEEKSHGRPIMHSKVFYARAGDRCRLWTGSHNLTDLAMQGINCEAAIRLEGDSTEKPFVDALQHLNECRANAVLYDPKMARFSPGLLPGLPPDVVPLKPNALIIHAESDVELKNLTTFIHLCLANTSHDVDIVPGGAVVLFLYPVGTLFSAQFDPRKAKAAFEGTQTALNFTEHHPRTAGIPAEWREAGYMIEKQAERGGIYRLFPARPPKERMTTQAVLKIKGRNDKLKQTLWLEKTPRPKIYYDTAVEHLYDIDEDMREFLRPRPSPRKPVPYLRIRTKSCRIELLGPDAKRFPEAEKYGIELELALKLTLKSLFVYRARFKMELSK